MRIAKLWCAALLAAVCPAQITAPSTTRPQTRDITLLEGRGELITFQRDVTKVAISEPKTADAVVISPREVMVNAKGPGRATLVIWETGADPVRYEIYVTKDTTEWDTFTKAINDTAGSPISVTGTGETIVLSGTVKTAEDSKRLAGMAQTRAKTVINLLQSPPPAEPRQIMLQVKFAAIDRVALTQIGFNMFSTNPKMVGVTSTEQFAAPQTARWRLMALGGEGGIEQRDQIQTLGDVEQGGGIGESGHLGFERLGRLLGAFGSGYQVVDLAEVDLADNFGFAVDALAIAGVVIGVAADFLGGEARHS